MLPPITNKQKTILSYLYRFRFLNRKKIQTLLKHKTFNRVNVWLKDLTEKNYIGRIIDTDSKINITPAMYYLKTNGIRFIKTQDYCEKSYLTKLYQENNRSKHFIHRCLLIADIYLDLLRKYGNRAGFAFYTQSDYTVGSIIKEIFPHFVFQKGKNTPHYVAEVLPEKPRFAILNRIKKYTTFFTNSDWSKYEKMPNILLICPNDEIEDYVVKKVKKVCDDESATNVKFYTTTLDQIRQSGVTGDIWSEVKKE